MSLRESIQQNTCRSALIEVVKPQDIHGKALVVVFGAKSHKVEHARYWVFIN